MATENTGAQQTLWTPPPGRRVVCSCGRPLRHRDSIAAGQGPVCRGQRNRYPTRPRPGAREPGQGQLNLLTTEDPAMGRAAHTDTFNGIARHLIEQGVDDHHKRLLLGPLITALQEDDWDTEDESLAELAHDPVIVKLFAERGIALDDPGAVPVSDQLRQAAKLIRDTARSATRGPWINLDRGDRIIRDTGDDGPLEYVVDEPLSHEGNADHIALWDPIVADAVAAVLERAAYAFEADAFEGIPNSEIDPDEPILALVRALTPVLEG